MKTIKVKSFLTEAIKVGDPETAAKLKKRAVDLSRLAKEAKKAANIAAGNGDQELADQLNTRAKELEDLVKNINIDTLDSDPVQPNAGPKSTDTDSKASDKQAEDAEDAENKDDTKGSDIDDAGTDADDDKADKDSDKNNNDGDDYKLDLGDNNTNNSNNNKSSSDHSNTNNNRSKSNADDSDSQDNDNTDKSNSADPDNADKKSGSDTDSNGTEDADNKSEKSDADGKGQKNNKNDDSDESDGKSNSNSGSSDGSDQDENNQDDANSDDEPIKDPFADDEDIPQLNIGSPNGKDPRDATVEDIIKQLKGLNGEAKRGAIDGLKDLLDNSKNESLTEAKLREARGLRDMSDDEFGDLVNDTIDMIEKAHPVSTVDDMKERKARIASWANSRIARRDLDTETTADVKAEKQAVKARKKELDQYGHYMSLSQFEISFSEAIKNQVDEVLKEFQTYDEINTEYEDEGIIMKADIEKLDLDEAIPRICVYFDQSGSWNSADIETGKSVIATVKKKYVDTGLCKLDLWYFDDIVTNNAHDYRLGEGGTGAWREILKNIQATNADNVVILTDSDMQYSAINGPTIGVNGCVWFLWKRGINAPACVSHLIGAKGNYEASFKPGETV